MQTSGDLIVLHEGNLAQEFGVSRTPIRQVLQKLAYERLVETRSGVGTIVSELAADQRDRDTAVLKSLLRAAADVAGPMPMSQDVVLTIAKYSATAESAQSSPEDYLKLRGNLLELAGRLAPDTILGDAIKAANWRHIRWRMSDQAWAEDGVMERLIDTVRACLVQGDEKGIGAVFTIMARADL